MSRKISHRIKMKAAPKKTKRALLGLLRRQINLVWTTDVGRTLPAVLWALAIGTLLMAPFLAHVSTSLIAGREVEGEQREQYAANAGIEFGIWKLLHDTTFRSQVDTSPDTPVEVDPPIVVNQITTTITAMTLSDVVYGWTSMNDTPSNVGAGGDLTFDGGDYLYAFAGGDTTIFWRYSISGNTWAPMTNTPVTIGSGAALAHGDTGYAYVFRGLGTSAFGRYNVSGDSWEGRTNPPDVVSDGSDLVYTGGDELFAFRGGGTATFWRYSISGDSWTPRTDAPDVLSVGGALAYTSDDYIYALRCSSSSSFWRYSITGNTWSVMASAPATFGGGCALAYNAGDYLYAQQGQGQTGFYRYSISQDSWTILDNVPAAVDSGGSLVAAGANGFFATRGDGSVDFWRYIHGTPSYEIVSQAGNFKIKARIEIEQGNVIVRSWDISPLAPTATPTASVTFTPSQTPTATNTPTSTPTPSGPPWWNCDWSFRKKITIDATKVAGDLVAFPVLISLPTETDLAADARDDGFDIVFTASDGITKLSHEIERFDGATGELVAWVKVLNLSGSSNTDLYMYYGNPSSADSQDAPGTWNTGFVAVLHMDEASGTQSDSTGRGNDGSLNGGTGYVTNEKMNGSRDFDGTSGNISLSNSTDINIGGPYTDRTISLWFNADTTAGRQVIYEEGAQVRGFMIYIDTGSLYVGGWNTTESGWSGTWHSTPISINTWYHVTLLLTNGTATVQPDKFKGYLNGSQFGTGDGSQVWAHSGDIRIAMSGGNTLYHNGTSSLENYFDGTVDEWRVANDTRSGDWIGTEYNNQSSPSTFILPLGSEEYKYDGYCDPPSTPTPSATPTSTATPTPTPSVHRYWFHNETIPLTYMMYPDPPGGTAASASGSITFNSDIITSAQTLESGFATVYLQVTTGASGCNLPVTLWAESTEIGNGIISIPSMVSQPEIFFTSFPSSEYFFYQGGRISVEVEPCVGTTVYWDGEYNIPRVVLPDLLCPPPWWDTDWQNRKLITLDSAKIDEDLTDLPILVKLTTSNFDFTKALSGGEDIRFVDQSGGSPVLLKYEIERWDSVGQKAEVWVKVPSTAASEDTYFYIYYNNPSAIDAQDAANTWAAGYVAVLHLDESSGTQNDSTGRGNDGSLNGTTTYFTDEHIDGSRDFDGLTGYISLANSADINVGGPYTNRTISVWFNADTTAGRQVLFEEGGGTRGFNIYIDTGNLYVGGWNLSESGWSGTWLSTGVTANTWYHVTLRLKDGTDVVLPNKFKGYLNGIEFGSGDGSQIWDHSGDIAIARSGGGSVYHTGSSSSANYYDGTLDEWRLANAGHSAAWIKAEYNSQIDTLLSYGSEEVKP